MQATMITSKPSVAGVASKAALKPTAFLGGVQAFATKARGVTSRQQVKVEAYDQSFRYADLDLTEEELIEGGEHLLTAYRLEPKPEYGFLETAAHVAAESSTGTNVEVGTTDDFTRGVDAMVYDCDEETRIVKLAYPCELFDRNLLDDQMMICQITSLVVGNNQGMGDIIGNRLMDFYVPEMMLERLDGPFYDINDLYDTMKRPEKGFIVGTIVKPKLGLRPKPFKKACVDFWMGGDFIKNDEPQGNQTYCRMKEVMPMVLDAMKETQDATGMVKIFSVNVTADDPHEMEARWTYNNELFGENQPHLAMLVDGFVAGPTAVTHARRNNPNNFIHYHRAGHGSITSLFNPRGYPAQVHCKLARLMGASGIHTGTMGYGKMEGENKDREIAYMLERDTASYDHYTQEWMGMKPCSPIISGGMNALRMPGFFKNLGHCNLITTAGGGSYGHIDGPSKGATSMRQSGWCYEQDADPIEFAKDHEEFARAFETFQGDADKLYPGWREQLLKTSA